MAKIIEEIGDLDWEWFAVDSRGQMAFFTTAGSFYVPDYYRERPEIIPAHQKVLEDLPEVGGYKFVNNKQPGLQYSSWTEISQKGLYGYDYEIGSNGGYTLVTVPEHPIGISQLIETSSLLDVCQFDGVFGIDPITRSSEVLGWVPAR